MTAELIDTPEALEPQSLPPELLGREDEQEQLQQAVARLQESTGRNLHIHGTQGQGKSHLTQKLLEEAPERVNTCYVPCKRCNTQYKALKQVYDAVTQDPVSDGYHTSDLTREIQNRIQAAPLLIVLDDIEFALLNDGDSLLYTLSRLEHGDNLSIITTSNKYGELPIEERTQSSLQPQIIELPEYSGEQTYSILARRAQDALKPQSLHREALTYIASSTSNLTRALIWLQTTAKEAGDTITEDTTKQAREKAGEGYADHLLQPFTQHHKQVYQAIQELTEEGETDTIQSGAIYQRYQEICNSYSEDPLSDRRISDYLKQLELLNLIKAEYHYGGQKGKTRTIKPLYN
jgi:orc1/cdc6 family replication initiation protein